MVSHGCLFMKYTPEHFSKTGRFFKRLGCSREIEDDVNPKHLYWKPNRQTLAVHECRPESFWPGGANCFSFFFCGMHLSMADANVVDLANLQTVSREHDSI